MDNARDGFKLSVYASIKIPKGSPILFNYVKPLDTQESRKESLLNFKFFHCKCPRCQDPTEFNTFNSAYLCPKCEEGPVIAKVENELSCNDCNEKFEIAKARKIDLEIMNARKKLSKIQARADLTGVKNLGMEFEKLLYPSHGFMLEIRQAVITCTAAAINNPGTDKEPFMQKQRVECCQQVLDSLDILEPGLSIGRGNSVCL